MPDPIQSMALYSNAVWVSSGPHVVKYVRGKEVSVKYLSKSSYS